MTYFTYYAKLMDILTRAARTIYSINKAKVHQGFIGSEWEQRTGQSIVSDLDSNSVG